MNPDIDVIVREVGLRDGLQIHPVFMPTERKLAWIEAEAAAGVSEIEVTSYVPAKVIPQFADAEAVTVGSLGIPGLTVAALIPNYRGAERGIDLGVHKLNFVMSVSRTHNMNNVRREREESIADFKRIVELVRSQPAGQRPILVGGLATALGCSFEGRVPVDDVVRYAVALAEAGADELVVPDTVGYADPAQVRRVFKAVLAAVGDLPVAAHFHDTRGTGLANVTAALDCGVKRFDASLAGIGGCPFAPGATGNIVMDDLVFMLDSMGLRTGVDIEKLVAVREIVRETLPDIEMHGAIARAGLPKNYLSAAARAAA
ncbi:hydroxymethylglutaryl-CoA lyase [Ramlibacter sp.]|uniref:hydroxymethylglutaryl-CoA lyase n=1 Tax=Ramlibacter sp. TaxID=1917967 RepID=UPI002C5CBE9E|nr:hydroxymethylglutaryl-CoA lyase [Ramlibacter sp.]HWI82132.1 hydroxymethylglutaryl-CoA lyase [Ramlibacter sp.]